MSGHVERLEALLSHLEEISRRADRSRPGDFRTKPQITADFMRQSVDPDKLRGDLRAALDELKGLRAFRDAIDEAQASLQSSSFYVGWLKGFNATPTAGVYTQAHLDTVAYAEELRAVSAKAAPQQPEPDRSRPSWTA